MSFSTTEEKKYRAIHQNSIYMISLLRTFVTNHLEPIKRLHQIFKKISFSLPCRSFLTLLAAFCFLTIINFLSIGKK